MLLRDFMAIFNCLKSTPGVICPRKQDLLLWYIFQIQMKTKNEHIYSQLLLVLAELPILAPHYLHFNKNNRADSDLPSQGLDGFGWKYLIWIHFKLWWFYIWQKNIYYNKLWLSVLNQTCRFRVFSQCFKSSLTSISYIKLEIKFDHTSQKSKLNIQFDTLSNRASAVRIFCPQLIIKQAFVW